MFCRTEDPFTLLPHCLSLSSQAFDCFLLIVSFWSIKEPGTRHWYGGYFEALAYHFLGLILVLASIPCLLNSLAYRVARRATLDLVSSLIEFRPGHCFFFLLPYRILVNNCWHLNALYCFNVNFLVFVMILLSYIILLCNTTSFCKWMPLILGDTFWSICK